MKTKHGTLLAKIRSVSVWCQSEFVPFRLSRCPQCSNIVRIWATVETSPVNLSNTKSITNIIEEMKSSKVMKHLTFASHRATMSTAPRKPSSHHDFCLELVRKRDRDHYLTSLLLPHKLQSLGFALRALNIQVPNLKYVLLLTSDNGKD